MNIAFLIGRIIFGVYYLHAGIRHFTHVNMMAGYAGSKGFLFRSWRWLDRERCWSSAD